MEKNQSEHQPEAKSKILPLWDFKFYESQNYEHAFTLFNPTEEGKKIIRNFMKFFLYGGRTFSGMGSLHWLHNLNFLIPLAIKKSTSQLETFASEIRYIFRRLMVQLDDHLTPQQQNEHDMQINLIVFNLLSIYVFTDPKDLQRESIPMFNHRLLTWELKDCKIQKILMTSHPKLKSLLKEEDHVYCYGIVPLDEEHKEDYSIVVIFMGTGVPTAQGIAMQDMTNGMPDYEIGQYLVEADIFGDDNVRKFLEPYQDRRIILAGPSLGGMETKMYLMYLAPWFPNLAGYAFNPATFFELPTKDHPYFGTYVSMHPTKKPKLTVLMQQSDPVSGAGLFLPDTILVKSKFPDGEEGHPSIEHLVEFLNLSLTDKILNLSKFKSAVYAFISHLVIHATHSGASLEMVESIELENMNQARKDLTKIAKEKVRPFLYRKAQKDYSHLTSLPNLRLEALSVASLLASRGKFRISPSIPDGDESSKEEKTMKINS